MEYFGNVSNRKVDNKRRIVMPSQWIDDHVAEGFFFVQKEDAIELYPYKAWKNMLAKIEDAGEKLAWAKRSSLLTHLLTPNRLLLPNSCTWQRVDLIGVGEYIVIKESTL